MKGPGQRGADGGAQPSGDAFAQLVGGPPAEGEHQDGLRVEPVLHPPGHRLDDRGRLTRTRPGQDEQRTAGVIDDTGLVGVEDRRARARRRGPHEPICRRTNRGRDRPRRQPGNPGRALVGAHPILVDCHAHSTPCATDRTGRSHPRTLEACQGVVRPSQRAAPRSTRSPPGRSTVPSDANRRNASSGALGFGAPVERITRCQGMSSS